MRQTIEIIHPGLLTTVQDPGRPGMLHIALSRGGAMDPETLRIANLLVGNPEESAGLEITGLGPTIYFPNDVCLACCGAPVVAEIITNKNAAQPLPINRPVVIRAQSTVRWKTFNQGFRAWLAIAGGIDGELCLGSRSGHLAAGIGPRRIVAAQQLRLGPTARAQTALMKTRLAAEISLDRFNNGHGETIRSDGLRGACLSPRWSIPPACPAGGSLIEIDVTQGRHFSLLSKEAQEKLLTQHWQVSPRSNRQGLGLEGRALDTTGLPNLLSEPVREGTVQLPPGGVPYILMAEHQTTGGYPRVLEIPSSMRGRLAQAGPGTKIQFKWITAEQLQAHRKRLDQYATSLRASIGVKLNA